MMICLEVLIITINKLAFGDHGAKLISEGMTNTKTLRILDISYNKIGTSGTIAMANALSKNSSLEACLKNSSLEALDMSENKVGQDGAIALANAITNNKTLKLHAVFEKCYNV